VDGCKKILRDAITEEDQEAEKAAAKKFPLHSITEELKKNNLLSKNAASQIKMY